MFGSYFGKKQIVELMVNHPVAKNLYSEKKRYLIPKIAPPFFKLFGYPLSVYDRQRARIIMKYLNPKKGERILDAGCGIGYYSFELASKFGCQVNGIDIDKEDIQLAKQIAKKTNVSNVEFDVCDIFKLKFEDETFDKIILSEVLEHIADDVGLIKELRRVLKRKGNLIISTPYVDIMEEFTEQKKKHHKQIEVDGGHIRNGYSLEGVNSLLMRAGLDLLEYEFVVKKFAKSAQFPMFLLVYPFSYLDDLVKGKGKGIIVKVEKKE